MTIAIGTVAKDWKEDEGYLLLAQIMPSTVGDGKI
jgi:hypothetical protein